MADTNTYTSKQNIKKYTTQAKFDVMDKSDVPVGTEYNIVGSITESDLDSDLQAKVNLTGDNLTTEVTGGKVKVKNPMTSTGGDGFKLNSFYNATTGVTYFFPIETPIGHFATGIVPILGSIKANLPGSTSSATYHGLFLQNAYTEDNYNTSAYSLITATYSSNSGNQIYILPYCESNPGVSYLLNNESLIAGNGITIQNSSAGPGKLEISYAGSGSPSIGSKTYADFVLGAHPEIVANYGEPESGTVYAAGQPAADGGSGYTRFVLLAPTGDVSVTLRIPNKGGTLATLDDIPTGGTTYTAGKNIAIDGTTIKTTDTLTGAFNATDTLRFGSASAPILEFDIPILIDAFVQAKGTSIARYMISALPTGNGSAIITNALPSNSGTLTNETSFKTLFGNQNLVGSGNIDLYNHCITIKCNKAVLGAQHAEVTFVKTSSSNLKVDSLTDLKTLMGDTFSWYCSGWVCDVSASVEFSNMTAATAVTNSGIVYILPNGTNTSTFGFSNMQTIDIIDVITTV